MAMPDDRSERLRQPRRVGEKTQERHHPLPRPGVSRRGPRRPRSGPASRGRRATDPVPDADHVLVRTHAAGVGMPLGRCGDAGERGGVAHGGSGGLAAEDRPDQVSAVADRVASEATTAPPTTGAGALRTLEATRAAPWGACRAAMLPSPGEDRRWGLVGFPDGPTAKARRPPTCGPAMGRQTCAPRMSLLRQRLSTPATRDHRFPASSRMTTWDRQPQRGAAAVPC